MYLMYALWWYLCPSIFLYYPLIIKKNHFNNIISLSLRGYRGEFYAWHIYSLCNAHTPGCRRTWCCPLWKFAEMVYSIMLPLMTLTLLSVYCFILLYGLVWFDAWKCYICLPFSAHGLWEWLMILTLFAQIT